MTDFLCDHDGIEDASDCPHAPPPPPADMDVRICPESGLRVTSCEDHSQCP